MKKNKGSILAYALIILSVMLLIVAAITLSTLIDKKAATSTDFSTQAYQTADSAAQAAFKIISENLTGNLNDDIYSGSCVDIGGGNPAEITVPTSKIIPSDGLASVKLQFYKKQIVGPPVALDSCGDGISDIDVIKALGTYRGTLRVVELDVLEHRKLDLNSDLVIVLDKSASMSADFPNLLNTIENLIDQMDAEPSESYQVSVVFFSNDANDMLGLTKLDTDKQAIKDFINGPRAISDAATNTPEAIDKAIDILDSSTTGNPHKYILFISDGVPHLDPADSVGHIFESSVTCNVDPPPLTAEWDKTLATETLNYTDAARADDIYIYAAGLRFTVDGLGADCAPKGTNLMKDMSDEYGPVSNIIDLENYLMTLLP